MHFPIYRGVIRRKVGAVRAVDGVSLQIRQGETLGLVEDPAAAKPPSGAPFWLYKPTSGHVYYKDTDLAKLKPEPMRLMRKDLQMIFQDPYASLNPRMTVRDIIGDPMLPSAKPAANKLMSACRNCLSLSVLTRISRTVTRMNFPAVSVNASALLAPWQ